MILPNGALVAVLDGKQMRLFRNVGHEPRIDLVELPEPELAAGNRGSGTRHHSSAANPDRNRIHEDDFAAAAVGYLNREALAGHLSKLLIIADPRTLGELRKHYHHVLTGTLCGQIAKDLVGHTVEQIQASLGSA